MTIPPPPAREALEAMGREELLAYAKRLLELCDRAVEAVDSITWQWEGDALEYPEKKANALLNDLIDATGEPVNYWARPAL